MDSPNSFFIQDEDNELDEVLISTNATKGFSSQMMWLAHMEATTTAVRNVETQHERDKFINDITNYFDTGHHGLNFNRMAQDWNLQVAEQERTQFPEGKVEQHSHNFSR